MLLSVLLLSFLMILLGLAADIFTHWTALMTTSYFLTQNLSWQKLLTESYKISYFFFQEKLQYFNLLNSDVILHIIFLV